MDGDDQELDYYRSVEDLFASLRGNPHVLSPRDFQLLRSWWREEIPLTAVTAGLTEVFARQREREDGNPVVSLSYCRHAVKRQAKRFAEMHVGGTGADQKNGAEETAESCLRLSSALVAAADAHRERRPAVADVLVRMADQVETVCRDLSIDLLDEHLFALESTMLDECRLALPIDEQRAIDHRVEAALGGGTANDEARQRSLRALRDREVRLLLDLPRLELGP